MTRDHVFPSGLFTKPLPDNPVIVDAGIDCNNGFKLDEQFFRDVVATRAYQASVGKKLERGSEKYKRYRAGKTVLDDIVTDAGIFLGKVPIIQLEEEENWRFFRIVGKILMGLHMAHFNSRVSDEYRIYSLLFYYPPNTAMNLLVSEHTTYVEIGGGRVKYRYGRALDEPRVTVWGIVFYDRMLVFGTIFPVDLEPEFRSLFLSSQPSVLQPRDLYNKHGG